MRTIDQKIADMRDEANLWAELLFPHRDTLRSMKWEELAGYHVGQGPDEGDISAAFAIESFAASYGRLREIAYAKQEFWPSVRFYHANIHGSERAGALVSLLNDKCQKEAQDSWALQIVEQRIEGAKELLQSDAPLEPATLFIMAHRYRRAMTKAALLEWPNLKMWELLGVGLPRLVAERIARLPSQERSSFIQGLRRYLASEYLFPWLTYGKDTSWYSELFMLAQLEGKNMTDNTNALLDEIFSETELNSNTRGMIVQMLKRLGASLVQLGDFKSLVEQIIYGEGQWGENSMMGSVGPVNIIPYTDNRGSCQDILLAFAMGRKSPKYGLRAVVRQVREHLIRCCDTTRIVIIFTDTWDPEIFAESAADFRAHRDGRPPKAIIGALVNGDRITLQRIGA